ncbi:unnamed protein product, partial [Prorocentrum cordatum]
MSAERPEVDASLQAATLDGPLEPAGGGLGAGCGLALRGAPQALPVAAWAPTAVQQAGGILGVVRRQMEDLEERLSSRLDAAQRQSARLQDAAIARLEEKVTAGASFRPRAERRLAELSGALRGVSDELQVQIRRADGAEEQLREVRRCTEEEIRKQCEAAEAGARRAVAAGQRAAHAALE